MIRCELICHRPLFRFSNCDEQRPAIESKLLGDVKTIKALAASVRGIDAIPVDYYVVFSEIEAQLCNEFDFVAEAAAMRRIHDALHTSAEGSPCASPVVTPLPVAGLVSKRVLVMDYLKGEPLSRALELMRARGIDPDGAEAKLFGQKLLSTLTEAFGRTVLEGGFFHADPHPGNIFILDDGRIGLIDFGQVIENARRGVHLCSPCAGSIGASCVSNMVTCPQRNTSRTTEEQPSQPNPLPPPPPHPRSVREL